ncbi:uncharacterized protein [Leptinotarsa decemlineata]|uniref:uncharacterized protein n=1 Tax=Leptinotarsa decemlineata TaxID=7539 RepID=UPI000C252452|nr:uncharacterized protein LOC111502984 [Leptinotarsa decemlineata]XP_023012945.1 uncharacterized protein LOC111502984 [Leptinotarsa decemlineata]
MELPQDVLETMRCGLCNNYLSVAPISTVTSDNKKHRCGRCTHIETRINNRNILYEKIAQIAVFPCTFPSCEEKLPWGRVEGHEKICEKRTLRCPVSWRCDEVISVENIIPHCKKFHHKNVCEDSLTTPMDSLETKRKFTVMLLVKEGTPFLVFMVPTSQYFWTNVFSLYPQKKSSYKLGLVSSSDECCLSFCNKIIPYDPRKHCKRCAMNDCPDKLHESSVADLDEYTLGCGYQKINRNLVTELKLKEMRYTVIIENNVDENSVVTEGGVDK